MKNQLPIGFLVTILLMVSSYFSFAQSGAVYPLNLEICETTASFNLEWTGSGTVDKWEVNSGAGWSDIATTNTQITVTTPVPGTYLYRAYINLGGGSFAYSIFSTVEVAAESAAGAGINFSLTPDARCEADNIGTISINAGYTGDLVNWVYSTTNSAPWIGLGESNTTLNFEDLTETTYYKAEIKSGACPSVLTTNTATVIVNPDPVGGTISANTEELCASASETATLTVGGNVGSTFTWQRQNAGVFTNLATGTAFTTPAHTAGNYTYRLQASQSCLNGANATVTKTANSNELVITSYSATSDATPIGEVAVASADATNRTISVAPPNGSVIRWENSTDNSQWTPLSTSGNNLTYNNLTTSTWFRPVMQNGTCPELASTNPVKITVSDAGTISSNATEQCNPSAAGNISVSGVEAITYAWESSTSPFTTWTNVTNDISTISFNALTETTKYRINADNGNAISSEITITVSDPTVAGSLSTNDAEVCENDATARAINLNGQTGNVIRWESSETNGAPWTSISNTSTTLNFDNLATTTYYRAVVQNGACNVETTPSLEINVVTGGEVISNQEVCILDPTIRSIELQNQNGNVLRWQQSVFNSTTQAFGAYTNIGNAGSNTITYSNLSTTTRYRAVMDAACAADVVSEPAVITVYQNSVGGTISTNATVRPGNNSGTLTLTGQTGDVVRWETSSTGTAPWTVINNTATTLDYQNLTQTTFYRAIVQNGACAEAVSSNIIEITVANAGFVTGGLEVCSGDATVRTLTLNNHVGTINGWQRSTNGGTSWSAIAATAGLTSITVSSLTQTTAYRAVIREDGANIFSDSTVIIVNPLPVPNFSAAAVCLTEEMDFLDASTLSSGTIINREWTFGDGASASTQNPSHTFATEGSKNVTLKLTTNKLCEATTTQAVTVRPLPAVSFSAANACDQNAVSFTNNSVLAGSTLTYSWNFDDASNTSSATDPTYTFTTYGDYHVKLRATSAAGCTDSVTNTITIYENPTANFVFANVCDGESMGFTSTSTITDVTLNYAWDFGDGSGTSTLQNPNYTFANADTFNVDLTVTSANGCTDVRSRRVEVYPSPQPSFTVSDNCFGLPTAFTNTSTIADGSMTYNWVFKDGNTSSATNPTITFGAFGNYLVELTATSDENCVVSVESPVTIFSVPSVNFSFNEVCEGTQTDFVNISSFNDSITYAWDFGDNAGVSTDEEPGYSYANAGSFSVKLVGTTSAGCVDSVSKFVEVHPNPVASFAVSPVCLGETTNFTDQSSIPSGSITNYSWDLADGYASTNQNPSATYASAGTKMATLMIESDNGCTDTTSAQVIVNELPQVSFSAPNECFGVATQFSNTSSASTGLTHAWNFRDNGNASTAESPSYTFSTDGNYLVTLVSTTTNGCVDSAHSNITVYQNPVADFSFSNVCAGAATMLINNSSIDNSTLNYVWSFGEGSSTVNTQNTQFTYSGEGMYEVKLIVSSPEMCVDSIMKMVTVYPNPIADFSVNDTCFGFPTITNNNSSIASGTQSYSWDFGDGTTNTSTSPSKVFASTGMHKITLTATSDNGCVSSTFRNAEVFGNPAVNFAISEVCEEDTSKFVNTSSYNGAISYTWDFGDNSGSSTDDNPNYVYANAGIFNVRLIGLSANGCADTAMYPAQVNPNPTAGFTNTTVCSVDPTSFTSTSTISSGNISSYNWSFGDGKSSTLQNPANQYANAGFYRALLEVSSAKACTDTVSNLVAVDTLPIARFSVADVCDQVAATYIDQSSNVGSGAIYSWDFGDGVGNSNAANPSYTYANSGTYTVDLVIQKSNGCQDSASTTLVVNPNPVAGYTFSDACAGSSVQFTNASTINSGFMQFAWSFAGASATTNSTASDPLINFTSPGSVQTQLNVTSDKGCQDSLSQVLTIFPNPDVDFQVANVCVGDSSDFINLSTVVTGSNSYTWNFGNQNTSTAVSPSHLYSGPGNYSVMLTATTNNGCEATMLKTTQVYFGPKASFNASSVCAGKTSQFINTSSIVNGQLSYAWDFNDGNSSMLENPTHVFASGGTYNVALTTTSANGCSDSTFLNYTIYHLPVVAFTFDSVCDGATTSFANQSTVQNSSIAAYLWDFEDLSNSVQQNPKHTFLNAGNYNVSLQITSDEGCISSASETVPVYHVPVAMFSAEPVCLGTPSVFVNETFYASQGNGTLTYTWDLGDGTQLTSESPDYLYDAAGTLGVQLVVSTTEGNCADSIGKLVTVWELPQVNAGIDTNLNKGYPYTLEASASEGMYIWSPSTDLSDPTVLNPEVRITESTVYTLLVMDENGCENSDEVKIGASNTYALYLEDRSITNFVTPNGNGENETWVIENIDKYPDNNVVIYDRWGQEVWRAQNYQNDWNGVNEQGDALPDGTYYYVVFFDNTTIDYSGAITLLRNVQ